MILKDKFLSQCASDIRIKLQQVQQQDPATSLDEMTQTATNTFYNRIGEGGQGPGEEKKERDKASLLFFIRPLIHHEGSRSHDPCVQRASPGFCSSGTWSHPGGSTPRPSPNQGPKAPPPNSGPRGLRTSDCEFWREPKYSVHNRWKEVKECLVLESEQVKCTEVIGSC